MRSRDATKIRRPVVVAVAAALIGGCALFGARVDSSWGPLPGPATGIAVDGGPALDLPRFALQSQKLPSGLRIGVEAGSAPGLVAVVTVVGSGASADPPGREGLAHLVEHLAFHAHASGARPYSERLARLGASYNADTSLDATRFYEVGPASALPALLELASERLLHTLANVDERDFARERAIVENELDQRNEIGVYGNVMAWMQRALFPAGHPYARPVGGSTATVRGLTLADARAFAAAHYRPDNASLLVMGDTGARPLATVSAALGDAARIRTAGAGSGTLHRASAFPERSDRETAAPPADLRAGVALPEIWIAYDLGGGAEAAGIAKVLTARAGEAMVRQRLMPEREVLAVDFHVIEQVHSTILACQIVLEHAHRRDELAAKAQNLIWALWSDAGPPAAVTWEGWRQGTVGDLRQAALADAVLDAEPFLQRALERATALAATGAIDGYDRQLAAVAAVRPQDVSGRAFSVLAPERARTLFLSPATSVDVPSPGPVGIARVEDLPIDAKSPFRGADLGPPPRVPAPAGLRDAKTLQLPNGMMVVVMRRPQFPAVTALLGFHGGGAALPPGVLELVRAVDPRRAGQPDATVWRIEPVDGPGYTADLVHTDRSHLPVALSLLANRVQAVAETDWAGLLARAQARANPSAPLAEDPRRTAAAQVRAALYADHPFARHVRRADLLALPPALVPAALPRLYNPRNAVLVIAGDVDPEQGAALAARWFGAWRGAPETARLGLAPVPPPARPGRETVIVTPRPVGSQVELTFACRLPSPASPREEASQRVAASLLEGILTRRIREEAGAAYSVDVRATALPAGAAQLEVAMSVETRRLREVLRVVRGEVTALAAGHVDTGALSQARWALAETDALRFQTGRELAEAVLETVTRGLSPAALPATADETARVDGRDVARAFGACVAAPVLSLVGDEPAIRAAL